jgi:beta-ribofuranosylaminobenzene 5'-phosphate synthase
MVYVQAYSRLHFGLLRPEGPLADPVSPPGFGGVGLMIAQPDLLVHASPAAAWSAEGPLAERALSFARRFAEYSRREGWIPPLPPHRLRVQRALPEHVGLGCGTQLGLAVARALAVSWSMNCDAATLARRVGRGMRSALGTHGFEHGGLLVESGKSSLDRLAPLVARLSFPEDWHLVLALPAGREGASGLHGRGEMEAFERLAAMPCMARTDALCRLVLLGLLPALVERNLEEFGEALHEFNVRVGEAFAPVQGGVYASPVVAELVAFVRAQDVRGVGQSSWGPTVFAVVADNDQAERLAARLRQRFGLDDAAVWVTTARNHGATVEKED